MENRGTPGQQEMTQALQDYFSRLAAGEGGAFNQMLGLSFLDCDHKQKSLTLMLEPETWMINSNGVIHGGVIAAVMDVALGAICRYWARCDVIPTARLNIRYLHPVPTDQTLVLRAELTGERFGLFTAEGCLMLPGTGNRPRVKGEGRYYAQEQRTGCPET